MSSSKQNTSLYHDIPELKLLGRGKVRDVYDLGGKILFVTSDRISAFDYIMPDPIPDKGRILTGISEWWFTNTEHIIDNHLLSTSITELPNEAGKHHDYLVGRTMIVKKAKTLPIEFIVRGYITGGGWKEYKETGSICGNKLPDNLIKDSELAIPIFTPSTKADTGHDENIDYATYEKIINDFAKANNVKINPAILKDKSIQLFEFGKEMLEKKGILLADTKFEFGLLENGEVILIDEALTPDSSRFWLAEDWKPGDKRTNYDKQILRDWLENTDWDKNSEPPNLPEDIISATREKYITAYTTITGLEFEG